MEWGTNEDFLSLRRIYPEKKKKKKKGKGDV